MLSLQAQSNSFNPQTTHDHHQVLHSSDLLQQSDSSLPIADQSPDLQLLNEQYNWESNDFEFLFEFTSQLKLHDDDEDDQVEIEVERGC